MSGFNQRKDVEELEVVASAGNLLSVKPSSQWKLTLRRFRGRKSGMIGLTVVSLLVLMAIFAPILAPYEPNEVLIGKEDVGPRDPPCVHALGCSEETPQHVMGTDGNVRDEFSRVIYGARVSLTLGFFTVTIADRKSVV